MYIRSIYLKQQMAVSCLLTKSRLIDALMKAIFIMALLASGGFVVLTGWSDYLYPPLVLLCISVIALKERMHIRGIPIYSVCLFIILFILLAALRGDLFTSSSIILLKFAVATALALTVATVGVYYAATVYVRAFEFLMMLSLFLWALGNLFPLHLITYAQTELGDHLMTLYGFGYYRNSDISRFGFFRNQSVFWEPGVYGVFCTLTYLIRKLYLRDNKSRWVLYLCCILSTVSMGSIIIFVPTMFYLQTYDISNMLGIARWRRIFTIMSVCLVMILIFSLYLYSGGLIEFFELLFGRNIDTNSSIVTRMMDLRFGSMSALGAPFLGHGDNMNAYYSLTLQAMGKTKAFYDGGLTNSIVSLFYKYGIIIALIYLGILRRACRKMFVPHVSLCFCVLIGCLMIEPLAYSVMFLLFITWPNAVTGVMKNYAVERAEAI